MPGCAGCKICESDVSWLLIEEFTILECFLNLNVHMNHRGKLLKSDSALRMWGRAQDSAFLTTPLQIFEATGPERVTGGPQNVTRRSVAPGTIWEHVKNAMT